MKIYGTVMFLGTFMLFLVGCGDSNLPSENITRINLADFLLAPSDMPSSSWVATEPSNVVIDRERTPDYLSIAYYSDLYPADLSSVQQIFRYRTIRYAKIDFQYASTEFGDGHVPSGWTFKSERASESSISCRNYPNVSFPICYWIARYDRIVIDFSAWLIPDRMTLADMEHVVEKIDARASEIIFNK